MDSEQPEIMITAAIAQSDLMILHLFIETNPFCFCRRRASDIAGKGKCGTDVIIPKNVKKRQSVRRDVVQLPFLADDLADQRGSPLVRTGAEDLRDL